MKGYKLLRLGVIVFLIWLGFVIYTQKPSERKAARAPWIVIAFDGRYYIVDERGKIYATVSPDDADGPIVSCVDLEELEIRKEDMDKLKAIPSVLKCKSVSEVCVRKNLVIMEKGIMLYFHKWNELERYFEDFEKLLPYISPRSVLELFEGGNLVIIKGGWKWQGMSFTPP